MIFCGFDVGIVIDGDNQPYRATEYKEDVARDGKSARAYIEAVVGCEYWIEFRYVNVLSMIERIRSWLTLLIVSSCVCV